MSRRRPIIRGCRTGGRVCRTGARLRAESHHRMRLGSWFKASRSASTSRQRGIAPLRRDDGEGYRELLTRMAQESWIETPTAEDLPRVDRKWKGKTPPNADWKNRPIRK